METLVYIMVGVIAIWVATMIFIGAYFSHKRPYYYGCGHKWVKHKDYFVEVVTVGYRHFNLYRCRICKRKIWHGYDHAVYTTEPKEDGIYDK